MTSKLPHINSVNKDENSPNHILTGWLEAIANFYLYYNQLIINVNQRIAEYDLQKGSKTDTEQYLTEQLRIMIIRMQRELEKLLHDIDQEEFVTRLPSRKYYEKLATHTVLLNQLNCQAQLRLDLSRLSTS